MAIRRYSATARPLHLDRGPTAEKRAIGYTPTVQEPEPGWFYCNGAAISRTLYQRLFSKISTSYGVGDGSTTFNLPDYRGRSMVFALDGAASGARVTALGAVGTNGGEENHSLSITEMPAHTHGGATGVGTAHSHGVGSLAGTIVQPASLDGNTGPAVTGPNATAAGSAMSQSTAVNVAGTTATEGAHTHPISSQGGGGVHNNVHPYQVAGGVLIRY